MKLLYCLLFAVILFNGCKKDKNNPTSTDNSETEIKVYFLPSLRGNIPVDIFCHTYSDDSVYFSFNYTNSENFYQNNIYLNKNNQEVIFDSTMVNEITLHFSGNDKSIYFDNASYVFYEMTHVWNETTQEYDINKNLLFIIGVHKE